MTLDRYASCPGGKDKKIKFCCADLGGELDQVHRMLQGEQRQACLDFVRKSLQKFPDRACLLAIECLLESELGEIDALKQTLATFEKHHPNNPVMLAEKALYLAETEGPRAGIEPLQRAIEASGQDFPTRVSVVIGVLGRLLLGRGLVASARAHLMLDLALSGGQDSSTMSLLARLNAAADLPLLLKDDRPFEPPPEGLSQRAAFEEALALAARGQWLAAADRFDALAQQLPNEPSIWKNLATLRLSLADNRAAVAALRRYSALDVPWEDAVEAEALAELIDEEQSGELVDIVAWTFTIEDVSEAQTRLAADRRAWRLPIDPSSMAEGDQPPPLAGFRLLDRPQPESVAGIAHDQVPRVAAEVFLFGKQTDRAARLELIAPRGAEFESARGALGEILGRELGSPAEEEVIQRASTLQRALTSRWHVPADTPPQVRLELARARRHHVVLEVWPTLSNPVLQGKSPREAAADPALRIPLAAAVLNLELASVGNATADAELFATLRTQLGVPPLELIDPTADDIETISAVRLARLKVEGLSDENLLEMYQLASWLHVDRALARLAAEIVRRPSLDEKADKAEAYGLLARLCEEPAGRMQYVQQARELSKAKGRSCAPWDLAELAIAAEAGDGERFNRLITHIRNQHMREPGVGEALMNLLQELGLIGPGGRAGGPPAAPESPSLIIPGQESSAAGGTLWTPGTPPPSGPQKSVIWTPGG